MATLTMQMTQMMHGDMWVWMLLWALVAVAILAAAVVASVWLVRRLGGTGQESSTESPIEVLRRRYAEGEIDEDEYLKRRSGLDV